MVKNKTNIALVDDHALLRSALASMVKSFDRYSVSLEADNGKEFIQQLKTAPAPDIVLLDIKMPEMDGIETAIWLNLRSQNTCIEVMDTDAVIISMLKHGARGYSERQ